MYEHKYYKIHPITLLSNSVYFVLSASNKRLRGINDYVVFYVTQFFLVSFFVFFNESHAFRPLPSMGEMNDVRQQSFPG